MRIHPDPQAGSVVDFFSVLGYGTEMLGVATVPVPINQLLNPHSAFANQYPGFSLQADEPSFPECGRYSGFKLT